MLQTIQPFRIYKPLRCTHLVWNMHKLMQHKSYDKFLNTESRVLGLKYEIYAVTRQEVWKKHATPKYTGANNIMLVVYKSSYNKILTYWTIDKLYDCKSKKKVIFIVSFLIIDSKKYLSENK